MFNAMPGPDPVAQLLRAAHALHRLRVDVTDAGQAYRVKADLPGVKKEDINVHIDGNAVSIAARIAAQGQPGAARTLWSERASGWLYRSFTLPAPVDEANAHAQCKDGVLLLQLPKQAAGPGQPLTIA